MPTRTKQLSARWRAFDRSISRIQRKFVSARRNNLRKTLQNIASFIEDRHFEWIYRVETAQHVQLKTLHITRANKDLGVDYEPVRVRAFRKLMAHLQLPADLVFTDMGCGKGRAMILAAEFSFRRVIGVEFSPTLCAACERNIAAFCKTRDSFPEFAVIEADAAEYCVSRDEAVFFFFNPFRPPVMEAVLQSILCSLDQEFRTIWIILANPRELGPVVDSVLATRMRTGEFSYGSVVFSVWSNAQSARSQQSFD